MQKALVAFDSEILNTILQKMLEDLGFEVTCTSSANQLAKICAQEEPCVVFFDLTLEGQDTLMLASAFLGKKPVLIVVSANTNPKTMKQALQNGANEYIMKPFDNDILQSKLSIVGLL